MENLKLWKIWNDGTKEKTTWNKERPVIEKNYRKETVKTIHGQLEDNVMGSLRITNFSSLKLR